MTKGTRISRIAVLTAFLGSFAAGAQAAQANWSAAISKSYAAVKAPSTAAQHFLRLNQTDPAIFDRVANQIGSALQALHKGLTPESLGATQIEDFIAAQNARARQIAAGINGKNKSPAAAVADAADAERFLFELHPIIDAATLKALGSALPLLAAKSEQAFQSASRLADKLLADIQEDAGKDAAPAPPAPPPLPIPPPQAQQPAPQAQPPSQLSPRPSRREDIRKMRDAIRDIAEFFTNDSLMRRPKNLGFRAAAASLAYADLGLDDIKPGQEETILEHLYKEADGLLEKYIAVVDADKIYGPEGHAWRVPAAKLLRLRLLNIRGTPSPEVQPAIAAAPATATAPPAPPTPEMIRKLQFQGLLHAAAAVVTQIYNDRGLFPGRREKIEKDSSVYGQWISFYWEVIDVVNFPKYEEHMAQMTAELVQAYKDALYSKRDLTDDELQSKRDAIEALEARVTALRKNDSQP